MSDLIEIDGSFGEGGGQILRTSLSLAAITGQAVRITNIRAGRPKPGLAAQHLTAVRAVAEICNGTVSGDEIGSQVVEFRPGSVRAGDHKFDVAAERGSAGATSLVLQTILPPLAFAEAASRVTVLGGTNVPWSPCFEYLLHVFAPCLARMGVRISLERPRAGFYPHGGGAVVATVQPTRNLGPLHAEHRGRLEEIIIHSVVSSHLPQHIGPRQIKSCRAAIGEAGRGARVREVDEHVPSGGPGTCVVAAAVFEHGWAGRSSIGERGKPAEKVGAEAGRELGEFLRGSAALDERLSDQVLLWAAMAVGQSRWTTPEITTHLETNAHVISRFLDVSITWEQVGRAWLVTVQPR
ncbi:MAG: RNA 3'-terminal phosphate cyclase [Armatimonadetes bacterium]|nr:RNA 3'-terminal phosphate cyclase [Armatimonadota bacterium]